MNKLRAGVVGLRMGFGHAQNIVTSGRYEVVALCDMNEAVREKCAAEFPEAAFFTDAQEMFEKSKLDVVTLAVPHHIHADLSVAASEAGLHVVVEKPMATQYDDCVRMIEAAKEAGRVLTVYHNRRLDGWFRAARSAVRDGLLGDLVELNVAWGGFGHSPTWRGLKRESGGVAFDWGAHLIDYASLLADSEIEAVSGFFYKRPEAPPEQNEDHAAIRIHFASGAIANVTVSAMMAIPPQRFKLLGTRGTLVDEWHWGDDSGCEVKSQLSDGLMTTIKVPYHKMWYPDYYVNLADHIEQGAALLVPAEEAARNINVLCTAERSAKDNGKATRLA